MIDDQNSNPTSQQIIDWSILAAVGLVFGVPIYYLFGGIGIGIWLSGSLILVIIAYTQLDEISDELDDDKSFNERLAHRLEEQGVSEGYDEERVKELTSAAQGSSIGEGSLLSQISPLKDKFLIDYLDENEQPHHLIKGGTIDVEGGGDSSSLFGDDRSRKISTLGGGTGCYTLVTDKRIYTIVQQVTGNDERNIHYDAITGVDLDTGLVNNRLTIHTKGRTYHISGFQNASKECRAAMEYIRKMKNNKGSSSTETEVSAPLDDLKRLQELREQGTLTEDEFQTMKEDILES